MTNPVSPQKSPYKVIVEEECACGLSKKQPFCDGSHKKDGKYKSIKYLAEESKEMYFCGCKMTKHPPFCDGSHSKP